MWEIADSHMKNIYINIYVGTWMFCCSWIYVFVVVGAIEGSRMIKPQKEITVMFWRKISNSFIRNL